MIDPSLLALLPDLRNVRSNTLWYADENVADLLSQVPPNPRLHIVSNRYDIYQHARACQHKVIFCDFIAEDYPVDRFSKIIYRVSKEKALVHHLVNQAATLLNDSGELIISGEKTDGIKTYSDKIKKCLNGQGVLKKQGNSYRGCFYNLSINHSLDDQHYPDLQKIATDRSTLPVFFSKPGVFGWNKIDKGSDLLLEQFGSIIKGHDPGKLSLLDLGCGYGWIFLNLKNYRFKKIVATDNNAAAIHCANHNKTLLETPVTVIADDCAQSINESFDIILCNPPFHQGYSHAQALTQHFLSNAASHLKPDGFSLFVVNQFIPLEELAKRFFLKQKNLINDQGFKVVYLQK